MCRCLVSTESTYSTCSEAARPSSMFRSCSSPLFPTVPNKPSRASASATSWRNPSTPMRSCGASMICSRAGRGSPSLRAMPEDRSHDVETDAERERLRSLIARLSDKDLSRPMPAGWTVAGVLAHIGFWDARAIYWMDKWARGAAPTPYEPENTEAVNESAKPLCLALPPRDAAKLSLRLAEEADGKVKALSDAMLAKIRATGGPPFNLSRAIHRKEHLDQIDDVLRG